MGGQEREEKRGVGGGVGGCGCGEVKKSGGERVGERDREVEEGYVKEWEGLILIYKIFELLR